ncbi:mannose-6-phosphate isomerase [Tenacibaculum holothuriorum]|uniref:Phosphohexomutase n=1 Tax=Tenacibaculum holothuriorum TaxID=1635173 RepID=A0A1Y2PD42_9FLAO|nr:type I phosphomannose isomerase catalytic subunit [Tenacibaculum holothuriorum]OSY88355.1 mannose-6-phosphate isomerase [Tenacibaculum holothuriorum]
MIDQLIKFTPILKEKIWGGDKLISKLHKKSNTSNLGESWEISGVDENISIVSNGTLKGKTIDELIKKYTSNFLGKKVYDKFQEKFPLLFKFIDASEKLSIQVHPNDSLSKERHNSFGKTEMWYILDSDEEAEVVVGFKKDSNEAEYQQHLEQKNLLSILNTDKVKNGDVYFIPTGRVHAIGAGVLLAEIQQTSDITYRVYDWDRKDSEGNERELHTSLATAAIDYKAQKDYKTNYSVEENNSSEIVDCPYFTTNMLSLNKRVELDNSTKDSFVVYMCVEGEVSFTYNNQVEELKMGETILVPACISKCSVSSPTSAKLLEVYIK